MEIKEYIVNRKDAGKRLDKYLSIIMSNLSRSYLQQLINQGQVLVNKRVIRSSYKIKSGDEIILTIPSPRELDLKPIEMDLDILYEDNDLIIVNKPPGLIVHPVVGNRVNTLVNALLAHTDKLSGINGVKRPGIVHRLDKDTSGALVVAKNDKSHRNLVRQFKERKINKIYHTIIKGNFPYNNGKIDAPIGRNLNERQKMAVTNKNSKSAVTLFKVLNRFEGYTYVEVKLETGRTHQIRVHFSYLGYPILGDDKYGKNKNKLEIKRQLLHAYKLGFYHPIKGQWMEFTAPIPEDFKNVLSNLKKRPNLS